MSFFHRNIILLLTILFCNEIASQKITLIDSDNERPIPNVLVFDKEKKIRKISNKIGVVNLNLSLIHI